MIVALYIAETTTGATLDKPKLISDPSLRDEQLAFKQTLMSFNRAVVDYVADVKKNNAIVDPLGNQLTMGAWQYLSIADQQFIAEKAAEKSGGDEYWFSINAYGLFGHFVWARTMQKLRYSKELIFSYIDTKFEDMYRLDGSIVSKLNKSIDSLEYEATALTAVNVPASKILVGVKFTNTTETEQVMSVTIDSREVSVTVPADSSKIEQCNLQPTIDSDIITAGEGSFEFLVKCDDNTGISTVADEEQLN